MWWRSDDSESHTERTLPTIVPLLLVTALIAAAWALFFAARENCSQSTQLAYTGLMTAVQIVVTELALGIAGVLRLPALVTANVALAVCVAAAALRARPARNLMRGAVRQAAAALREMAAWENGLLTLLAAFVLLWLTVAAVFLPPRGIDDLDYHLSPLYRTVQTGRIELLPLELRDFFAYPLNGELLFLWPLIFFHDDRFVDVVQLVVALYGTLVVYALARCFEVARRTSFFIGALFLFTPVVLGQAGSAYVDVIAGVFHLVVLLALVRFHRSGDFLHLAVAGVATGFAAGIKYSMLIFAAALQPLVWLGLRRRAGLTRGLRSYFAYLLLALPAFAYWPLRNLGATGHAFYPMQTTLTGFRFLPDSTIGRIARTDVPTILADFLAHPEKLLAYPFQDPGLGSLHGGFGAVFWGLCLPALAYRLAAALRAGIVFRRLFPLSFWGQVLVGGLALSIVPSTTLELTARYVLFVVGLGLVALGMVLPRLATLPGSLSGLRAFSVAACALAVVHLAGYQWPSYRIGPAVEDWIQGRQTSEYKYLQQAGWDLPSLSKVWEPLDYLTRTGDGWSVSMAAGYSVFWTVPIYGSRLQNEIWNFEKDPTGWPDAFIFHQDRRGRPMHYVGRRITSEEVEADGRYALVTQTPYTQLWVSRSRLGRPDVARLLADYDAATFAQVLPTAEAVGRLLTPGGMVITSSPLGYGLRHLALTGKLSADVHIVPKGHEDATAARLDPSTAYTVGEPLRGYRSRPIAVLTDGGVRVPIFENTAP
jgi:hypothetical protein